MDSGPQNSPSHTREISWTNATNTRKKTKKGKGRSEGQSLSRQHTARPLRNQGPGDRGSLLHLLRQPPAPQARTRPHTDRPGNAPRRLARKAAVRRISAICLEAVAGHRGSPPTSPVPARLHFRAHARRRVSAGQSPGSHGRMAAWRIPGAARRGKAHRTERRQARDIGGSSERGAGEDSKRRLAGMIAPVEN